MHTTWTEARRERARQQKDDERRTEVRWDSLRRRPSTNRPAERQRAQEGDPDPPEAAGDSPLTATRSPAPRPRSAQMAEILATTRKPKGGWTAGPRETRPKSGKHHREIDAALLVPEKFSFNGRFRTICSPALSPIPSNFCPIS